MTIKSTPVGGDAAFQHAASIIKKYRPDMTFFRDTYRQLHRMPELSGQEEETARLITSYLRSLAGLEIFTNIGGHGIAGVLANGEGPTILLRADMDGLPLLEKTELPYASKRTQIDKTGIEKPVMHACGHDTHVASMMAVVELLLSARSHWKGTLICLFQPAEEHLNGAKAMVDDGLYDKIPHPDTVLVQHVDSSRCGTISLRSGPTMTASVSLQIRIFGRGGHGSAPQECIDPIIIGSSIVVQLQTIVSREIDPGQLAVVTCGSIHAGDAPNIIPDFLDLKINIRALTDAVQSQILASVKRIVKSTCKAGGCDREPLIETISSTPATINDESTVQTLRKSFTSYFGSGLEDMDVTTASEDVSILATTVGARLVIWFFGSTDPEQWDKALQNGTLNQIPYNHSPLFAPMIESLDIAVDAMSLAALTLFNPATEVV
ncbi:amidohydrolase [Trichoderma arundinaceum]|uniref:Amidohydrolase n=1 Tax=Trichoderma arundinaceum TaxID=490622 RepID=A0A395NWU7_TRIAR|nr:amidohydrolase [Trichoderma arundinaceum]